jgi:hypothetical protein
MIKSLDYTFNSRTCDAGRLSVATIHRETDPIQTRYQTAPCPDIAEVDYSTIRWRFQAPSKKLQYGIILLQFTGLSIDLC